MTMPFFCAKMATTSVDIQYQWVCCGAENGSQPYEELFCMCVCLLGKIGPGIKNKNKKKEKKKEEKLMPKMSLEFLPLS